MKFSEKCKGSITILLTLIMLPTFTCAGLIVDGARLSAARVHVSGAGDLAMNAALSEYDELLKDMYGLFAMSEDMGELEKNVSRYFSNTINNSGVLEGSDSYTRSFINSIFDSFSNDDIQFENIVDTETEDGTFKLVPVPSSSIANPTVLERQIVEYMKFRAPLSIGKGLLSKLGVLGDTSKQTKALEKKVDYEKKLDTIQDACNDAFSKINTYNSKVDGSGYAGSNYINEINDYIGMARREYITMTKYILAVKSTANNIKDLGLNGGYMEGLYKEIEGDYQTKPTPTPAQSGETKEQKEAREAANAQALKEWEESEAVHDYQTIRSKLSTYINLSGGAAYNFQNTCNTNAIALNSAASFNEQVNAVSTLCPYIENSYTTVNSLIDVLYDCYNKLSADNQNIYSSECEIAGQIRSSMYSQVETARNHRNNWITFATEYGRLGSEGITKWYVQVCEILDTVDAAISALSTVEKKAAELAEARKKWGDTINDLSDGEVKTSMNGDYTNSAKDINPEAINSLKSVLNENQKHFSEIKSRLETITYYGIKVCDASYGEVNFFNRFSDKISPENITTGDQATSRANDLINANFVTSDVNNLTPASYEKIEKQQFYEYLKRVCKTVTGESANKGDAKDFKKKLTDQGNDASATEAKPAEGMKSNDDIAALFSEEMRKALSDLASGTDGTGVDTFERTNIDSGDDDKAAENSSSNLSAVSKLLDGFANILETARDNVYLEEYMTEMFSCYTSGKNTKGEDIEPLSLNKLNMKNNALYGSEVEYLLWGKKDTAANLNATKAMIFGIRFALNSVYAFTNSEIRATALTAATAIAGWTGFGVPIVQTVIIIAWSMAESLVDMTNLCNGKAVAVYKNPNTWSLSVNGGLKAAKDMLAEKVTDIVVHSIEDVFAKINDVAADKLGEATNSIKDYAQSTVDGAVESITSGVIVPLQQFALSTVGNGVDTAKTTIETNINEFVASLRNSISGEEDSVIKSIKLEAFDQISSTFVGELSQIISDCAGQIKEKNENIVDEVTEKITKKIDELSQKIKKKVGDSLDKVKGELMNKVNEITEKGETMAKEKLTEAINEFSGKLDGSLKADGSKISLAKKDKTTASAGIVMTYKEYVKAFTFLFLAIKPVKNNMLKRTSELVQANIAIQKSNFDITKAYSMVEVNASIGVKTTFFSAFVANTNAQNETTYTVDLTKIGADRQTIKYTGIYGY